MTPTPSATDVTLSRGGIYPRLCDEPFLSLLRIQLAHQKLAKLVISG